MRVKRVVRANLGLDPPSRAHATGLERVKVYGIGDVPMRSGRGLFADALVARFPLLPVEDEGRLNDPRLRATDEQGYASQVLAPLWNSMSAGATARNGRYWRSRRGSCGWPSIR